MSKRNLEQAFVASSRKSFGFKKAPKEDPPEAESAGSSKESAAGAMSVRPTTTTDLLADMSLAGELKLKGKKKKQKESEYEPYLRHTHLRSL